MSLKENRKCNIAVCLLINGSVGTSVCLRWIVCLYIVLMTQTVIKLVIYDIVNYGIWKDGPMNHETDVIDIFENDD